MEDTVATIGPYIASLVPTVLGYLAWRKMKVKERVADSRERTAELNHDQIIGPILSDKLDSMTARSQELEDQIITLRVEVAKCAEHREADQEKIRHLESQIEGLEKEQTVLKFMIENCSNEDCILRSFIAAE